MQNADQEGPKKHDAVTEEFLLAYLESKKIFEDPVAQKAFRKLQGTNNDLFEAMEKKADIKAKDTCMMAKEVLDKAEGSS